MKHCNRCSRTLDRSEFYAHKLTADGLMGICKDCHKASVRLNRQTSERARRYDRQRSRRPERLRHLARNTKHWRSKNPDGAKAQRAVNYAVRTGKLQKPERCQRCNKNCSGPRQLHGHHPDYSKPLKVEWLCAKCHHSLLRVDQEGETS